MISGKLGSAMLSAGVMQAIYTVPVNHCATVNISMVNTSQFIARVLLAVTDKSLPSEEDYIEFQQLLEGINKGVNNVLERTAIVMGEGEKVFAFSTTTGVAVRVHGFEEAL